MKCYDDIKKKRLRLRYDSQDLFNYYIHHVIKLKDINVLGFNIYPNTVNGLCVWSSEGKEHPNMDGLEKLYYMDNKFKSKYYELNDIHLLSFTFLRLNGLLKTEEFKTKFAHIINYDENKYVQENRYNEFNNLHKKMENLLKNINNINK